MIFVLVVNVNACVLTLEVYRISSTIGEFNKEQ